MRNVLDRIVTRRVALISHVARRGVWRPALIVSLALTAANVSFRDDARAEIVLDDFDIAFEIKLPDMNGQYQIQPNIGPLAAQRWVQGNACCGSRPTGRIDSNLTVPSALYSSIDRINPDPAFGPAAIGINLLYYFSPLDVTQNGSNDRVAVDFAFIHSAIPLARVHVFMQDGFDNYMSQQFDITPQDTPLALTFPFLSFYPRGGGTSLIDLKHISKFDLTISPVYFTPIDPLSFSSAVERIRFTNGISEPATGVLAGSWIIACVGYCARNRRRSHDCQRFLGPDRIGSYYDSRHRGRPTTVDNVVDCGGWFST